MEYVPTTGPLPGEQWVPSSANSGEAFISSYCCQCARDKCCGEGKPFEDCDDDDLCQILAASYRGEAVEWRRMTDGEVKCIAFVPAGEPIPAPRDDRTADMFCGA